LKRVKGYTRLLVGLLLLILIHCGELVAEIVAIVKDRKKMSRDES